MNVITINGKKYNAYQFWNKLIVAKKKVKLYIYKEVRKDDRYVFKTLNKGDIIGEIYYIDEFWTTFKNDRKLKWERANIIPKFFFVETKDIMPNLIDFVQSKQVKSAVEQQKEFEQKIKKKPSFWQNLNTSLFTIGGIILGISLLKNKNQ
jgi:hypothetical protein